VEAGELLLHLALHGELVLERGDELVLRRMPSASHRLEPARDRGGRRGAQALLEELGAPGGLLHGRHELVHLGRDLGVRQLRAVDRLVDPVACRVGAGDDVTDVGGEGLEIERGGAPVERLAPLGAFVVEHPAAGVLVEERARRAAGVDDERQRDGKRQRAEQQAGDEDHGRRDDAQRIGHRVQDEGAAVLAARVGHRGGAQRRRARSGCGRRWCDGDRALLERRGRGGGEVPGAGEAVVPVLRHRTGDHVVERARELRPRLARPRRRLGQVGPHLRLVAVGGERHASGEHLEQDRAERVDVCAGVELLAADLLRRDVVHRADELRRPGVVGAGALGQPEVGQVDVVAGAEEDVGGLDVPMDQSAAVGRIERGRDRTA
jgi:hypothetical protein